MGILDGKVAIVTGAGKGIGRAESLALAKDGAAAVLVGRNKEDVVNVAGEIQSLGGRALPIECDVSGYFWSYSWERSDEADDPVLARYLDPISGQIGSSIRTRLSGADKDDSLSAQYYTSLNVWHTALETGRSRGTSSSSFGGPRTRATFQTSLASRPRCTPRQLRRACESWMRRRCWTPRTPRCSASPSLG